VTDLIGIAN